MKPIPKSSSKYFIALHFSIFQSVDPSENDTTMIPPLLGFAKKGSAEGNLLYMNYGTWDDFQVLKHNFSISNCSGHIVIMRYAEIYRGAQVSNST